MGNQPGSYAGGQRGHGASDSPASELKPKFRALSSQATDREFYEWAKEQVDTATNHAAQLEASCMALIRTFASIGGLKDGLPHHGPFIQGNAKILSDIGAFACKDELNVTDDVGKDILRSKLQALLFVATFSSKVCEQLNSARSQIAEGLAFIEEDAAMDPELMDMALVGAGLQFRALCREQTVSFTRYQTIVTSLSRLEKSVGEPATAEERLRVAARRLQQAMPLAADAQYYGERIDITMDLSAVDMHLEALGRVQQGLRYVADFEFSPMWQKKEPAGDSE